MITTLHVIADVLLAVVVVIYDRRITELEDKNEEIARKIERLARRIGRPYT